MRRTAVLTGVGRLLVCALLGAAADSFAATPTGVPAWEQTFTRDLSASNLQTPVAVRELADGSRMVVLSTPTSLIAARYDASGSQLSSTSFTPAFLTNVDPTVFQDIPSVGPVAIDAFGGVFLGAVAGLSSPYHYNGDAWIMKYDGTTGRPAWAEPAVWHQDSGYLASPRALLIDSGGNVIVSILEREAPSYSAIDQVTVKLDGASGGVSWGPLTSTLVGSAAAALDAGGNAFVAIGKFNGTSNEIDVVKYASANGSTLFGPVTFDTPDYETPAACAVAGNGDLIVAGPFSNGGFTRGFQAIRLDGITGSLVWGPARWTASGANDGSPTAVAVSPSGTVFVSGYVSQSGTSTATVAFSGADGTLAWGPVSSPNDSVAPPALAAFGNGDVLVASYGSYSQPGYELRLTRLRGTDGAVAWAPVIQADYSAQKPPRISLTATGSVVMAYTTGGIANVSETAGATGTAGWGPVVIAGSAARADAAANDMAVGPDGNPVVTGFVRNDDYNVSWATIKYDASTGTPIWGPVYFDTQTSGYQNPWQVDTDSAGNVVVAGYLLLPDQEARLAVVKYSGTTGATLWTSAIVSDFYPNGLAIDPAGNPVLISQIYDASGGYDVGVLKLSGSDGHVIWGPVLIDVYAEDYPSSVAVDSAGNVMVSGAAYDYSNGFERWFTAKLSSANGAVLWGPVLSGGAYEVPAWMVVDAAGNVIVTGTNNDQVNVARMMTIKYDGATGATLWGPVYYDSPAQFAGGIWVAVDGSANLFATGISWSLVNDVYNADFVTIKYSGADGSALWGPVLFDGPANGYDLAYSVEVDAAGNAVVAGNSQTGLREYRFVALKYDGSTGAPIWGPSYSAPSADSDVNDLKIAGGRVFLTGQANRAYRTVALTGSFGIATEPEDLRGIACGEGVATALLAANGTPPYSWSVSSGALPAGLSLDSDGTFSGTAQAEGTFNFTATAHDATNASASRDFTLDVHGGPFAVIQAAPSASCAVTLSVQGTWSSYQWLPGGETSPTINVMPTETTTYGVRLSDGSGCVTRGATTITATALVTPGCLAPALASVTPASGPSAGGTGISLAGAGFQPNASVSIGSAAATNVSWVSTTELSASSPALAPGVAYDVLVRNPDTGYALLSRAWVSDFLDVPPSSLFYDDILSVLRSGVSSGCGAGNYCPLASVTRAQMAVFLVRAKFGSSYAPPAASGTVFLDVPADAFAAAYIEQLAALGITGGCGGGNYCPNDPITRAQMAPLLLRTLLGEKYTPPPATGVFGDVPPGAFAADWIEDLYARGITGGCSSSPLLYCPAAPVTRGQMATFIVRTFGL